ncbi:MAG: hypothetical protein AB1589_41895 [Cyanobacteriota bacterium]
MELATLDEVAVVAEFDTLPAVLMVESLVSTIPAVSLTSALTTFDEDKTPAVLCTTPSVENPGTVITPVLDIDKRVLPTPLVTKLSAFELVVPKIAVPPKSLPFCAK